MENKSWVIYGLREDLPGSPLRYVGYTTKQMAERLRLHKNDAKKKVAPVSLWIRSVNFNIVMEVIEECPHDDIDYILNREVFWIAYYREIQGSLKNKATPHYLKNHQNGGLIGSQGNSLSTEHKNAIRIGVQNHFRIKGHKSVYEFWVDRYGKPEADRMLGVQSFNRSIAMSGENNHMFGKTGQLAPCYGRVGEKHPMFGTHHSEEAKRKISEKTLGKPKSTATKVRMSLANHNRWHNKKKNKICKWCLGADLQNEIDKAIDEERKANDMG